MKKWRDLVPLNSPLQKKAQMYDLTRRLEAIGWTIRDFARLLEVSPSCVQRWANGVHKFPRAAQIILELLETGKCSLIPPLTDVKVQIFLKEFGEEFIKAQQDTPPEFNAVFQKNMLKILA